MNKKFLSVVLFGALMAGSSVTFTGCIDNDEPAGIEELRGAKAELLKAKAAVETAKVAYVNAQTAQANAEARRLEAVALQAELDAKSKELDNALKEAQNAELIAEAEAAVEEAKAKLEQNKLKWEAEKLQAEVELAQAQKSYEDAMKAIELSKNFLSDEELAVLATVQGKLTAAKNDIYGYYIELPEGEVVRVFGSKEELDKRYKEYQDAVTDIENYITKESLEANLTNAQASFDFYTAQLNLKLEALNTLNSGEAYQAWLKLKEDYTAKKDSLETEIAAKNSSANKIIAEQTPIIDKLADAINTAINIEKTVATPKADKDSVFAVSKAIEDDLEVTDFGGFVTYENGEVTAHFLNGEQVLQFVRTDEEDLSNAVDAASYATLLDDKFAFADDKLADGTTDAPYKVALKNIDDAIEKVNKKKAEIASLDTEKAEAAKKEAESRLETAKKAKATGVTNWEKSIKDWKAVEGYATGEADLEAVNEALETYNNAVVEAGTDAKKLLKAQQTFADAIVAYYNAAAPLQLAVNSVTFSQQATATAEPKNVTKTVKEWLSDADNKDVYLVELIKYFGNDATKLWTVGAGEDKYDAVEGTGIKAKGGLSALKTKAEIKEEWRKMSVALYGAELGEYEGLKGKEGRETEPTEAEIKEVWEKNENAAGLCGVVLTREVELQTATENVEKTAQFDKVTAKLAEWKKSLASLKDAYIAEYKEELDAVASAQKAVTEKVATPIAALGIDKDKALLGEIEAVLKFSVDNPDEEQAIIKHVEELIKQLQAEIGTKKGTFDAVTGTYAEETTGIYLDIENAEADVFKAQKMLDLYNSGELTDQYVVDTAKEAYEAAKAQYEKHLEVFNYWNDKLAELMETLYGKVSAE